MYHKQQQGNKVPMSSQNEIAEESLSEREREIDSFNLEEATLAFGQLLATIEAKHPDIKYEDIQELYSIDIYHIEALTHNDVRDIYQEIVGRYKSPRLKRSWFENELRVFVWILFNYSQALKKPIEIFGTEEWGLISRIFAGKGIQDAKFEWLSLVKSTCSSAPWSKDQDYILYNLMQQGQFQNRWNDIARAMYQKSGSTSFRKPKQCRERWKNYLDPNIEKGEWSPDEDIKMFELVIKVGKKWSSISKLLETRTEHSVKNRYKSLLKKFKKTHSIRDKAKTSKGLYAKELEMLRGLIEEIKQKAGDKLLLPAEGKNSKEEEPITREQALQRFYPISPNSAWKLCDKNFSMFSNMGLSYIQSPRMISPGMMSPIFRIPSSWQDDTNRLFYSET